MITSARAPGKSPKLPSSSSGRFSRLSLPTIIDAVARSEGRQVSGVGHLGLRVKGEADQRRGD